MSNAVPSSTTQTVKTPSRDCGFDNIRGILIACVVFGHLLETCAPFHGLRFIYQTIYSFHIPVFIFLTGYFSRYDIKKILLSWVCPYLVFQILYITAERLLGNSTPYQFTTPYWHLWFLIACVFYLLLIPAYNTDSRPKQIAALICVTILALAIGFDQTSGHYMALSRFFVFQPWFLLGYYIRKYTVCQTNTQSPGRKALRARILMGLLCIAVILVYICNIPNSAFFGSYPYPDHVTGVANRIIIMLASFVWVLFFVIVLRPLLQRKIPLMTTLGQNTLPVYILHAFVTKGITAKFPQLLANPLYLVIITAAILFLFGNPFVGNIFRFLFSDRIWKAIRKNKNSY